MFSLFSELILAVSTVSLISSSPPRKLLGTSSPARHSRHSSVNYKDRENIIACYTIVENDEYALKEKKTSSLNCKTSLVIPINLKKTRTERFLNIRPKN